MKVFIAFDGKFESKLKVELTKQKDKFIIFSDIFQKVSATVLENSVYGILVHYIYASYVYILLLR